MWDYLKRQQLQRKGLSCGKKRREQTQSEWMETLRSSPFVRSFFLCLFLAGLGMLVGYLPPRSGFQQLQDQGMGTSLMLLLLLASAVHLAVAQPLTWKRNSHVLLVYMVVFVQLCLLQLADFVLRLNGQPPSAALLYAPCALAPITCSLLLGMPLGYWAAFYASVWGAMLVDQEHSFAFLCFSMVIGFVSIITTRNLRKRSQLLRSGLWVGVAGLVMAFLLRQMTSPLELWQGRGWQSLGIQAGSVLLGGILTVTIVNGMIPVLEAIFKITTTISWIELSDLNHPLLRRMTLEAPGTYHHSLMVASLAESAAEAIGADPTMCRVCSYFHDIGKLERPEYCIENIHDEDNPHDDLSPSMSALIIISHVKDGVDLALKHKLNRAIIQVIQQHHGNSLVWFFYRRAIDHMEEVKKQVAAGLAKQTDIPEVAENKFRYPGPRPQTRESAIISLADAIESASRVLQKPSPQKIEQMVDEVVAARVRDGQLDECNLTLRELDLVKESFQNRLRTMLHRRIPYPEEKASVRDKDRGGREKVESSTATGDPAAPLPSPEVSLPAKAPTVPLAASLMESPETARFGVRAPL